MFYLMKKENLAKVLNFTLCVALVFAVLQAVMSITPIQLFCDDLFEIGTNAISKGQQTLVDLAIALCPLSLIVIAAALLITHDPKKIAWLLRVAGVVFLATAAILVINSGAVVDTLQDWFGSANPTKSK